MSAQTTDQSVLLGDVADVLRGTVPAKTSTDPNGPRFFGLAEISERRITEARYPEEGVDLTRAVYLQQGDVVVALLGRLGESALIGSEYEGSVLGRECAVIRLRPHEDRLRPEWLYAWTRSETFRHLVDISASGTTMPRLPLGSLNGLTVPVAGPEAQLAMANRLQRFERSFELLSEATAKVERLREVEIDLAFGANGG